ncbi:MAG: XRE family transcriptional regulator [Planctomycetes bacterium]|nr:XRE family transcriptional regulator [Planctomycetota bacterium]
MAGLDGDLGRGNDREVMAAIGQRLAALRKSQLRTQVALAAETGLSRQTIAAAERGQNPTLLTIVRLLRAFGRLDALTQFVPEPEISPMALIAPPRRARRG